MSGGGDADSGWDRLAAAWIAGVGERGDWSRAHVLDRPMLELVSDRGFRAALDLGCGEGRFCRAMRARGIAAIGVDPTAALIGEARRLDPAGDYRIGTGEATGLADASIDLVVAYLTLIDIADLAATVAEIRRVLRPGGSFLFANLQGYATAAEPGGWRRDEDGQWRFGFDRYLEERAVRMRWGGIEIVNWHRPLSTYMDCLLRAGFCLRRFIEPEPHGGDAARAERYRRAPLFVVTEWRAPG